MEQYLEHHWDDSYFEEDTEVLDAQQQGPVRKRAFDEVENPHMPVLKKPKTQESVKAHEHTMPNVQELPVKKRKTAAYHGRFFTENTADRRQEENIRARSMPSLD